MVALVLERTVVWPLGGRRRPEPARGASGRREGGAHALPHLCGVGRAGGAHGRADCRFAGGNSLDQGEEYLLLTIAVVVIGGTAVAGGRASVPGIWGAALFMFLLVAMLNSAGAGAGVRMLLTGMIIIARDHAGGRREDGR